jgi:hypothetical protein
VRGTRGSSVREVALVAAAHAVACVVVLALGFDHVSDDDYARVTIAQSFAHAPKLDPSGTSWLPFPFWLLGGAMMAMGRSLAATRGASILFASLAAILPYVALRTTGTARRTALLASAFAMLSPWSLWLGAATVPESFTASFTAAAAIALGCAPRNAVGAHDAGAGDAPLAQHEDDAWEKLGAATWVRLAFALGLLAACLSRYEPWPVAAVLGIVLAVRAVRALRGATSPEAARAGWLDLALAAVIAVGPLAWMAWNAHAHGDAVHFFQRVARFKRALGEGSPGTLEALLLYPRLFVTRRPDITLALACTLAGAHFVVPSREEVRRRWLVALACAAAQVAFLAYGNVRDGAPAHHPERALLGVVFIMAAFTVEVLADAAPAALARARVPALTVAVLVGVAWLANDVVALRDVPGTGAADDRTAQIAAGNALRDEHVTHVEITPCAYEHFALIAAFGEPERVAVNPRTSAPVTASCPAVERR